MLKKDRCDDEQRSVRDTLNDTCKYDETLEILVKSLLVFTRENVSTGKYCCFLENERNDLEFDPQIFGYVSKRSVSGTHPQYKCLLQE